jgi:type II secretion system protein J
MSSHFERHTPSLRYPGEGERGERHETSKHGSTGKTAPVVESSASPASRALCPSPPPSPRRTEERESATCRVHASRGFTLLELLLALAMAAMLALSLYTAMNVALRARTSAGASLEPTRAAMIAMDLIQQDFQSVPPPGDSAADTIPLRGPFYGEHLPAAGGDNDQVEFCSIGADTIEGDPVDAPPLSEGIRRIQLQVQTDAGSSVLLRRVTRNLRPSSEPRVEEEILCRNVRSLSLRYFDGVAWLEEWDSTTLEDNLPLAIAITLELGEPSADAPTKRVTRVIPLPCAKPLSGTESMMFGGAG